MPGEAPKEGEDVDAMARYEFKKEFQAAGKDLQKKSKQSKHVTEPTKEHGRTR